MNNLVGIDEIAEIMGVSSPGVVNCRRRYNTFPEPVAELAAGPVFSRSQVIKWLKKRGKFMGAKVISVINVKDGVGKTTTVVGLPRNVQFIRKFCP